MVVFRYFGLSIESLLYCLLFSALLALSVIDFRTYEIPVGFNYFILILGDEQIDSKLQILKLEMQFYLLDNVNPF
jgi:prepilin signal peptidase PulO-like enzyme (type II secretory pathway)